MTVRSLRSSRKALFSTGNFHGFLGLVFRVDDADFSFVGEKDEGGRKLMEYRFEVPLGQGHYEFGGDGHPDTTAYEGTLTADPETADLVELTVRTRNLSTKTGACEVATSMKYSGWQVNGATFLLPERTRMDIRMVNGVEFRNESVYAGCREFLGESMLRFEGPGERESGLPSKAGKAPAAAAAVPTGLPFTVQLAQDIAVATAAAGDLVKAVLATDLADDRKILAPKGTALTCRIQRIRRYYNVHDRIEMERSSRQQGWRSCCGWRVWRRRLDPSPLRRASPDRRRTLTGPERWRSAESIWGRFRRWEPISGSRGSRMRKTTCDPNRNGLGC